ncbi:MAG: heparinase II/III family protein [Gammaproteobacteria bacterium]|nr:heparinase II/III family protein [Gammaproteobacteria bacterium]
MAIQTLKLLKRRVARLFAPRLRLAMDLGEEDFFGTFDIPSVIAALERKDTDAARSALLAHYRRRVEEGWPEPDRYLTDLRLDLEVQGDTGIRERAERVLDLELSPSGIPPSVDANGNIEWSRNVAAKQEWLWMMNRHAWWVVLGLAYRASGDERYADTFVSQLRHWIETNPPIPARDERHPAWRLMEVALRLRISWIPSFALFHESVRFDDDAKLLMLRSIGDHMRFLSLFHTSGNHLLREQNGLAAACCVFPEIRGAAAWREGALSILNDELRKQVNDDGSHFELSTGYQWLVIDEFEKTYDLLNRYGLSLPRDDLQDWLGRMCFFLGCLLRPDGTMPQINDGFILWQADRLEALGRKLGREDVVFLASGGRRGSEPARASIGFPNAGLHVMRDGWKGRGHSLLFDAGQYGGPHGHEDKLSIEVCAFATPLIVDPGSYTYEPTDPFRNYFVGSQGHNTVLVDGLGQVRRWDTENLVRTLNQGEAAIWKHHEKFDMVRATYDSGYGQFQIRRPKEAGIENGVRHERTVVFVKPDYWVIFDVLSAAKPHRYQALFHAPPDVRIAVTAPNRVIFESSAAGAGLTLLHLGSPSTRTTVVSGEDDPVQGWYSPDHHHKEPADVAIFETRSSGDLVLVTVVYPRAPGSEGGPISAEPIEVRGTPGSAVAVQGPGGARDAVMVSGRMGPKQFAEWTATGRVACFRMGSAGDLVDRFEWAGDSIP